MPDNKRALFERGHEKEALEKAKTTRSTLEAWFLLNSKGKEALQYTYAEIPEHYTWQKQATEWKRRQRLSVGSKIIGRLHGASPSEGERFYVYLLLLHVRGPLHGPIYLQSARTPMRTLRILVWSLGFSRLTTSTCKL